MGGGGGESCGSWRCPSKCCGSGCADTRDEGCTVMSIYVSTACLPGTAPLTQQLDEYGKAGLFQVELGAGVEICANDLDILAKRSEQKFLIHNYFPPPRDPFVLNLASGDAGTRRRSLYFVTEGLSLAACLGAPFYSVHAGFITDPTSFGTTSFIFPMPASPREAQRAMDRFAMTLERALDHAQRVGLQLLVENNVCSADLRGKLLLQTADEFLALFRLLPEPQLGILLDTGHLNVSAQTCGFDRLAFIEQVAPYVRAFHIHDNDGIADTHQPIPSGSWVLDVLRRPEFATLPIVVEAKLETVADLCRHVDWLRMELGRG